jgi:hypothetical protein
MITEQQLRGLLGSEQYRNKSLQEVFDVGHSAYGPIKMYLREDVLLELESPFFKTVIDCSQVQQTEDGPSIKALGEKIDEIVIDEINQELIEKLWNVNQPTASESR